MTTFAPGGIELPHTMGHGLRIEDSNQEIHFVAALPVYREVANTFHPLNREE